MNLLDVPFNASSSQYNKILFQKLVFDYLGGGINYWIYVRVFGAWNFLARHSSNLSIQNILTLSIFMVLLAVQSSGTFSFIQSSRPLNFILGSKILAGN